MRVIDPGHRYELMSLDGEHKQVLTFVKRIGEHYPGNFGEPHPGTTMQDVVRALLDRARYVNRQIPCVETELAIGHFQAIIALFELRAKRVKGKYLREASVAAIEDAQVCVTCGHISCSEFHHQSA
jgi:hypothetical protein